MAPKADSVNRLRAAVGLGFSLSDAVANELGTTLSRFADEHGHRQTEVSMCLGGYHQRTYEQIRDDLCAALEIPRAVLDELIDSNRPVAEEEEVA